jgi:hypothetical protein
MAWKTRIKFIISSQRLLKTFKFGFLIIQPYSTNEMGFGAGSLRQKIEALAVEKTPDIIEYKPCR